MFMILVFTSISIRYIAVIPKHTRITRRIHMQDKHKTNSQHKTSEAAEKTAGNNQWTNNNLKYYPDKRKRQDGPGGN